MINYQIIASIAAAAALNVGAPNHLAQNKIAIFLCAHDNGATLSIGRSMLEGGAEVPVRIGSVTPLGNDRVVVLALPTQSGPYLLRVHSKDCNAHVVVNSVKGEARQFTVMMAPGSGMAIDEWPYTLAGTLPVEGVHSIGLFYGSPRNMRDGTISGKFYYFDSVIPAPDATLRLFFSSPDSYVDIPVELTRSKHSTIRNISLKELLLNFERQRA